MSLELGEGTLGMWYVCLTDGNWLAHLARTEPGQYELTYRFRWYRDERIGGDSKDVRHFYRGALKSVAIDTAALHLTREIFEIVKSLPIAKASWELLRGARSIEEFTHLLTGMPDIRAYEPERLTPEEDHS